MKGLSKRERQAEGKKGGVVRMAFLTCIVPKLGENVMQVINAAGEGGAPSMDVDEVRFHLITRIVPCPKPPVLLSSLANLLISFQFGWMTHTDHEATAKIVFNDLPLEQGIVEAKKFGHHSGYV